MSNIWSLRLVTALLWALAMASGVYWTARMGRSVAPTPAERVAGPGFVSDDSSQQVKLARMLGGTGLPKVAAAPVVAERFTLAGVISSVKGQSAALISVDGQPARPFAIGMQIVSGYVLKAVGRREAMLAENVQSPVVITLMVPVAGQAPAPDAANRAAPANPGTEALAVPASTPTTPTTQTAPLPAPVPPVPAPLGSPATALLPSTTPQPPAVVAPGMSPEVGRTGPPPRSDMRRQAMPGSR